MLVVFCKKKVSPGQRREKWVRRAGKMDALCKESRENFHCLWQMTRQKFTSTQKQKNAKYMQKRSNKTEVFSIITTPDILLHLDICIYLNYSWNHDLEFSKGQGAYFRVEFIIFACLHWLEKKVTTILIPLFCSVFAGKSFLPTKSARKQQSAQFLFGVLDRETRLK